MQHPRLFLIHGWGGSPQKDWMPWAKKAWEEKGFDVYLPQMPDTDTPEMGVWISHLTKLVGELRPSDTFVGHSIGCQTILRYLEKLQGKADKVVLVAPWFTLTNLENAAAWAIADPWLKSTMNFTQIAPKANAFITIFSDNDPWVPYSENKTLFEQKLHPKIVTLHAKGHMTDEEGVSELPELLLEL